MMETVPPELRLTPTRSQSGEAPCPARLTQTLALTLGLIALCVPACEKHEGGHSEGEHVTIVTTNPVMKDVVLTQQYVCRIRSQQFIKVQAMTGGYLTEIHVKEGQAVNKGYPMFRIIPILYKAKWEAESAEAKLAGLELDFTKKLRSDGVVSENEVALYKAKQLKAAAKANLAEAEFNLTKVEAPFDGLVDKLELQLGSLIKEGEVLTTLSDNSVMWVYFNVPESRYLEYMAAKAQGKEVKEVDLVLANGTKFPYRGKLNTIEANFNYETGNIPFRADFPNPDRLLRNGQTGNVELQRTLNSAILIPQRATFEILEKRYVWVIDEEGVVHPREITVGHEKDDIFVVLKGLKVTDRIVLEGVQKVHDGMKLEEKPEHRSPDEVFKQMKYHAE